MKRLFFLSLILWTLSLFPQGVPKGINYQGVARNAVGAPITTPISVKVDIHQGSSAGAVACSEVFQNVNPNQFGIFSLQIGTVSPAQFSSITWSTGVFYIGVSIDPNNGLSFGTEISNQQLMSVPYALYAERAGNVSGQATITSSDPSIISVNSAPLSHTINYTPPQLTLTADTVLRIVQGNYSSTPVMLKTGSVSAPATLWLGGAGTTYLANGTNNVGIGTNSPTAKLEVQANPASTNNAIAAYAQGGYGVFALTSSASNLNSAVFGSNSGGGSGVIGTTASTSSVVAGVLGQNTGVGSGVFGSNMNFSSSSLANGVFGESNSTNALAAGVVGSADGLSSGVAGYQSAISGGSGVFGATSSSVSAGVYGLNNSGNAGVKGEVTSNAAQPNAHGVYGKTAANSSSATGVFGENKGAGAGVYGYNSSFSTLSTAHGVKGETNSSGASAIGVLGINTGVGAGMRGQNTGTGNNANAFGVIGLTSSSSTNAAGVMAENTGSGSAIRALSGTNSTLSLWVENGHIKATSNLTVSVVTATNSPSFTGLTYNKTACNDVKGIINIATSATGVSNGDSFEFNVSFNKFYQIPPTVVISGYGNDNVTYYLKSIFNSYFSVRIINRSGGNLTSAQLANMNVSYYVIE